MVKRRAFMMFFFALVLALGAAYVANSWLRAHQQPVAKANSVPVVVAALKIPFGQKIEPVHVKVVNLPAGTEPEGVYRAEAEAVGKVAKQTIFPGEILIGERVADQLSGSTLSAIIEPNKRAVTVRVNDVVGVAGFLLPGNRVDVVAARKDREQAYTKTILEDLKVLAVDQTASPEKDQPVIVRAVTLEMTPEEAEILVKATTEGAVQLTLRNPTDSALVAQNEKEEVRVQPVAAVRKPARVQPVERAVIVIRGTEVNRVKTRI
ncbi:MAG: Flp pilus assembly protein CpaB [Pseudomonadota bacterium]|nr:Flp pilus assembly protein CpaB [Pseudomonadota bacterium]